MSRILNKSDVERLARLGRANYADGKPAAQEPKKPAAPAPDVPMVDFSQLAAAINRMVDAMAAMSKDQREAILGSLIENRAMQETMAKMIERNVSTAETWHFRVTKRDEKGGIVDMTASRVDENADGGPIGVHEWVKQSLPRN